MVYGFQTTSQVFIHFYTKDNNTFKGSNRIHLDQRFVVYPGVAGVDDVEHEVPVLHWPLLHR